MGSRFSFKIMNTTYLIINALVAAFFVYTLIKPEKYWRYESKDSDGLLAIASLVFTGLLTLLSFTPLTGPKTYVVKDANKIRFNNEIIVSVDSWPTQITTDIQFIDSPVEMVQTNLHNAYGAVIQTDYSVRVKPVIKTEIQ